MIANLREAFQSIPAAIEHRPKHAKKQFELYYINRYLSDYGALHMPKNAKAKVFDSPFGTTWFYPDRLDAKQDAEFDLWFESSASDVLIFVQESLLQGDAIKFSYDPEKDTVMSTLTIRDTSHPCHGAVVVAWESDWETCLGLLMFKRHVAFDFSTKPNLDKVSKRR